MSNPTVREGEKATNIRYRMMDLAARMDGVISLGRGDPDLHTPPEILDALEARAGHGVGSNPPQGLGELRRAIAHRYAEEQMLDLVGQFSVLPAGSIVKKDQFAVSGKAAPFFIATYEANNSQQQQVEFGHTQLGLENPPYLLLVSYAAPREIYQSQLCVFQHMMDTFNLRAPPQ